MTCWGWNGVYYFDCVEFAVAGVVGDPDVDEGSLLLLGGYVDAKRVVVGFGRDHDGRLLGVLALPNLESALRDVVEVVEFRFVGRGREHFELEGPREVAALLAIGI